MQGPPWANSLLPPMVTSLGAKPKQSKEKFIISTRMVCCKGLLGHCDMVIVLLQRQWTFMHQLGGGGQGKAENDCFYFIPASPATTSSIVASWQTSTEISSDPISQRLHTGPCLNNLIIFS